jgi:hypothetical protein
LSFVDFTVSKPDHLGSLEPNAFIMLHKEASTHLGYPINHGIGRILVTFEGKNKNKSTETTE